MFVNVSYSKMEMCAVVRRNMRSASASMILWVRIRLFDVLSVQYALA